MDPFEVLGVAPRYDLDLAELEKRHREMSRAFHPDRHAAFGPGARKDALSRAVSVNESFRVLKDPVKRAEALFVRAGLDVREGTEPAADPELLSEAMERREALSDAKASRDLERVDALASQVQADLLRVQSTLSRTLVPGARLEEVQPLWPDLGKLRFHARFLEEVVRVREMLEEGGG